MSNLFPPKDFEKENLVFFKIFNKKSIIFATCYVIEEEIWKGAIRPEKKELRSNFCNNQ